ncbi:MAG TPA: sulfatase [Candidatus Dormibacteraeota bacterium]|nr:sulfatase [Candidatus Dormibacteraeota bacterium]
MRARTLLGLAVGLTAAAAVLFACSRPAATEWNVLVIVMDTVRGDHLSINGYQRATSPNLDALARDGANFTQAITAAPRTWQSFTTILTGLYPPHHGVRFIHDYPLDHKVPTLATTLGAAGYATHAFDRLQFLRNITGGYGFGDYYDPLINTDRGVLEAAWEWMQAPRQQPFFAFVRLNGSHWPYEDSPEEAGFESCEGQDHSFNERGWRDMGVAPAKLGEGMRMVDPAKYRNFFFTVNFDARTMQHMKAHYDAEVHRTDADIGWLVDQMRAAGTLDKTVIVVTADHGESFGEHGYLFHGPRVDEPVMRVPLIIRLPPFDRSAKAGVVVDTQVRTADIMPTILSAVGVPLPEHLDGISLLPALGGGAIPTRWAYAESEKDFIGGDPDYYVDGVRGTHRMARLPGWKLVYVPKPDGPEQRLYDLTADPGEAHNVAADHPDKVRELQLLLDSVLAADAHRPEGSKTLTDAEKEQLRQLGYMP